VAKDAKPSVVVSSDAEKKPSKIADTEIVKVKDEPKAACKWRQEYKSCGVLCGWTCGLEPTVLSKIEVVEKGEMVEVDGPPEPRWCNAPRGEKPPHNCPLRDGVRTIGGVRYMIAR